MSRHLYDPVTLDTVAAEWGLPVERVEQALTASGDPVTISLRIGTPVTRAAYESAFSDIALLLSGG
jgi:hypothetical protein